MFNRFRYVLENFVFCRSHDRSKLLEPALFLVFCHLIVRRIKHSHRLGTRKKSVPHLRKVVVVDFSHCSRGDAVPLVGWTRRTGHFVCFIIALLTVNALWWPHCSRGVRRPSWHHHLNCPHWEWLQCPTQSLHFANVAFP